MEKVKGEGKKKREGKGKKQEGKRKEGKGRKITKEREGWNSCGKEGKRVKIRKHVNKQMKRREKR